MSCNSSRRHNNFHQSRFNFSKMTHNQHPKSEQMITKSSNKKHQKSSSNNHQQVPSFESRTTMPPLKLLPPPPPPPLLLLPIILMMMIVFHSFASCFKIEHSLQHHKPPAISNGLVLLQPTYRLSTSANKQLHQSNHIHSSHLSPPFTFTSDTITQQQQQQQQHQVHQLRPRSKQEMKICIGTSNKLQYDPSLNLTDRYTNCTHVIGNLEITYVDSQSDLSSLESIREITGYLLIHRVNADRISMPNLQIIRGKDLFKLRHENQEEEFALISIENAIYTLELPNLREILTGSFGSYNNTNLCFVQTINWGDILNLPYASRIVFNSDQPDCPQCDSSCPIGACWSDKPNMCQLSKLNCAPQCGGQSRCFGPSMAECCHESCVGGCFGPNRTDCVACRNFYNDGACVSSCPPLETYNMGQYKHDTNPLGKYTFGAICVKECPKDLLRDNGACVRVCPANKVSLGGECIPCGEDKIPCSPRPADQAAAANSTSLLASSSSSAAAAAATTTAAGSGSQLANQQLLANSIAAASQQQVNNSDPFANCKAIINSTSSTSQFATQVDWPSSSQQQQQQALNSMACIKLDEPCPDGYYQEYTGPAGRPVCRRCHHRCKKCSGMGTHTSVCECAKYVAGEQCEDYCPRDYFADENLRRCVRCSSECNGCHGPTEADCHTCRVYRVYVPATATAIASQPLVSQADNSPVSSQADPSTEINKQPSAINRLPFNCTSQCPPEKPYRISESNLPDLYCSEVPDSNPDAAPLRMTQALSSTSILLMLIISGAIMLCISVHRFQSEKDKTVKLMTMHLSGIDDVEPLNPSNLKPNLAPLRSIKETELRKGKELGSGFGGTVYQGLWYPDGREHKNPRPVAIKVLRDNGQSNMNKKFLDEAYIMASVNHPNLVQLLAVCMTPKHLMLVTPLMPLGCLLEHVKKHRHDISSKNLLEWSKQIAKGMAYLEEHRMVHRDLALRNVLLKTCGRAMISDFGLAKFLELDQSEYHSLGGRLPIKWLAPECIRERRFTHKSDVWAFGVTVWELLTFGARPFEEYTLNNLLIAIENGARLEQPPYLTTEVYSIMLSCWFYKPEARPSFRQLTQDFVKFAQDPQRYVAIGTKLGTLDYNPSQMTDSSKFQQQISSTFSRKQQQQQQQHRLHSDDSEADEYTDSELEQWPSSSMAGDDEPEPEVEPGQLLAGPEWTPTTHNRINEMFGHHFNFRGQQRQSSSMSEASDGCQKTPTTPLKKMHAFATEQNLIEEADDDIEVFEQTSKQQLDGNNNFITVPADSSWQQQQQQQPPPSCASLARSHGQLAASKEQPRDNYDYLVPSPCQEANTHNFNHLCGSTATGGGSAFDEPDSLIGQQQQQQQPPKLRAASQSRSTSVSSPPPSRAGTLKARHLSHQSSSNMIGVENYEYFRTRASSQYLSGASNHHYADMDQTAAAAANPARRLADQQRQQQQQHLSTSNGNIPHSLV